MLIATSTTPSAISARPSGMRESLLLRGANELGNGAQQLCALDRLGKGARCTGPDRVLGAAALPGAEVAGHGDQARLGTFLLEKRDGGGPARSGHPHVAHHQGRGALQSGARRTAIGRLEDAVARGL